MGVNASGTTRHAWFAFDCRDWLAFDRGDYLATKVILGITALGSILFGLGGFLVDAVTNAPLPMAYTTTVLSGIALPGGTTQNGPATIELLLTDPTVGERLGQAIPGALLLTITVAVVWLLFQRLRSIQALVGEAFRRGVVLRDDVEGLV